MALDRWGNLELGLTAAMAGMRSSDGTIKILDVPTLTFSVLTSFLSLPTLAASLHGSSQPVTSEKRARAPVKVSERSGQGSGTDSPTREGAGQLASGKKVLGG